MSGKSWRSRGRHSARSKKGRDALARAVQQRVATDKPAAQAVPVPSPSVPTTIATPTGARYPYVVAELRRTGILAGVMLAILIVLALVLP